MEIVKVLGVDPGLRFTGLSVVEYNTETQKWKVKGCQIIKVPPTIKGTEAILEMLDRIEGAMCELYREVDMAVIESPPAPFNRLIAMGGLLSVAHISGGASVLFGLSKSRLVRPAEWNKKRKKEDTHKKTQELLGSIDSWEFIEKVKNKDQLEHVLDAASMAVFWIQNQYIDV